MEVRVGVVAQLHHDVDDEKEKEKDWKNGKRLSLVDHYIYTSMCERQFFTS